MFDRIGDIDLIAPDSRFNQRLIQEFSRRAHKRPAGQILIVTRLLAHKNDCCIA